VRRRLAARHVLRAVAASAVALALVVLAGVARSGGTGWATVRLVAFGSAAVAGIAFAVARFAREAPRFDAWLESLEDRWPALRSLVRNALDLERTGREGASTSAELAHALRAEAARRLDATPIASGRPALRARASVLACAGAAAALVLLAACAPVATMRSWHTLWRPELAAPPLTLRVEPGDVTVSPGATVAIRARVGGSAAAPRLTGDGANPAPQLEAVEHGERRWRFDLPPVTSGRRYAVRVLAARSPEYRIALSGRPQPVSFSFEYHAPGYARLPVQAGTSTSGDVAALRGSAVDIEVTFDRDLERLVARAPGLRDQSWHAVTPRRWRGRLAVREDGEWALRAEAASGEGAWRWRVSALPDAPPVISVVRPEGDSNLPAGSHVPFDVLVQDDLGLADLRLEYRKEATEPWHEVPLAAFAGEPREAHVADAWDAGVLALLPGQSGTFRFTVRDNDRLFGPGVATSPEFKLRFPSLSELYSNLEHRQETAQQSLNQVAEQARELQKTLDQLQRQQPRPGVQSSPQYARTEEMRKALERQQAIAKQVEKAAQDVRQSMAEAAEREAFREQLQEKLHEMSELMKEIQSSEFKDAVQRMKEALERMDPSEMERQLPRMRDANRDLLQSVERNLALLRQLRDEERREALARRADELKAKQDALNKRMDPQAGQDPKGGENRAGNEAHDALPAEQRDAAAASRQLAQDARDAAQRSPGDAAKRDLEAAARQLEQEAAARQDEAASQSESGQDSRAAQSGGQASQDLSEAAATLRRGSDAAREEQDARQLAAVRRAAQDLVSLGQQASQGLESPGGTMDDQANSQTDASDGVARVADSLSTLARETPLLPPQVQEALGRAMQEYSQSGRELAQGNRSRGRQASLGGNAAVRDAVNGLRDAESSMCKNGGQKPGGGPGRQPSPGESLGRLGDQQGQLNERSRELARKLSQAMRLSAGDQDEMRRIADEQARLRSELEDIQRRDDEKHQLLGRLDQARTDMKDVEEQLRDGSPGDDLEERQNRILSRLLDAQRSINRRDYDPRRESRVGDDVSRPSPAPLPASLLRENDRLRLGLMKADADRYPAQYRALIERYLRRLNGEPR
jgi:hypothetical protein